MSSLKKRVTNRIRKKYEQHNQTTQQLTSSKENVTFTYCRLLTTGPEYPSVATSYLQLQTKAIQFNLEPMTSIKLVQYAVKTEY